MFVQKELLAAAESWKYDIQQQKWNFNTGGLTGEMLCC